MKENLTDKIIMWYACILLYQEYARTLAYAGKRETAIFNN